LSVCRGFMLYWLAICMCMSRQVDDYLVFELFV